MSNYTVSIGLEIEQDLQEQAHFVGWQKREKDNGLSFWRDRGTGSCGHA